MASQSYQLVMRSGPTPGKIFVLDKGEISVGRDASNEITINDAEVSRRHARLVQLPGGSYMIEDMGSTNGTFVNGQRLMGPHTLRPGELVMFGENISLNFELGGYDPDATIVGGPGMMRTEMPQPPDIPEQPSFSPPQPAPVYAGQIPAGPAIYEDPGPPPARAGSSRTWLLAGVGCLLIICCLLIVIPVVIDTLNLWCTSPLRELLGWAYPNPCP